jgi:hypothetical protein
MSAVILPGMLPCTFQGGRQVPVPVRISDAECHRFAKRRVLGAFCPFDLSDFFQFRKV